MRAFQDGMWRSKYLIALKIKALRGVALFLCDKFYKKFN